MTAASVHPVLGIEWHDPVLPPTSNPELEAEAKRYTGGTVPRVLPYLAASNWLATLFVESLGIKYSHADPMTMTLVAFVASHENACRYCYGHRRAMLRIQGFSDERIARLEHDLELAELSEDTRATLEFARALARSRPRPARAGAEALQKSGVSSGAVAEIVGEVANWCLGNRVATALAVPPESEFEAMPESFLGKLFRPLIARKIRRAQQRVSPPPPVDVTGVPYGKMIEPLAATHMGRLLSTALERVFSSDVLPARTVALSLSTCSSRTR